jgi:molybdopterin molybdotransferase
MFPLFCSRIRDTFTDSGGYPSPARRLLRPLFKVVLREELRKKPGRVRIVRIRLEREDGRWYAASPGNQQTSILRTMVAAEAFAILPADSTCFAAGDEVDAHFYGNHIDLLEATP